MVNRLCDPKGALLAVAQIEAGAAGATKTVRCAARSFALQIGKCVPLRCDVSWGETHGLEVPKGADVMVV